MSLPLQRMQLPLASSLSPMPYALCALCSLKPLTIGFNWTYLPTFLWWHATKLLYYSLFKLECSNVKLQLKMGSASSQSNSEHH